jgi:hypothetical protein
MEHTVYFPIGTKRFGCAVFAVLARFRLAGLHSWTFQDPDQLTIHSLHVPEAAKYGTSLALDALPDDYTIHLMQQRNTL